MVSCKSSCKYKPCMTLINQVTGQNISFWPNIQKATDSCYLPARRSISVEYGLATLIRPKAQFFPNYAEGPKPVVAFLSHFNLFCKGTWKDCVTKSLFSIILVCKYTVTGLNELGQLKVLFS